MSSKDALWEDWLKKTLLEDVRSHDTPDQVVMFDESGSEITQTEQFDTYRKSRGDGDYLYIFYLSDGSIDRAEDVHPVYIGETNDITQRLNDHVNNIQDAFPVGEWYEDGSEGPSTKYYHIAAIHEQADAELCAWILDVDDLDSCPYGFATHRQELEAKLVGLVHSQPRFQRPFANAEFVPNRIRREINRVGPPEWVDGEGDARVCVNLDKTSDVALSDKSEPDLWHEWVEEAILQDMRDSSEMDPIPLFETDEELQVQVSQDDTLERSEAIEEHIRNEGKKCVTEDGVKPNGPDGLLYVMYHLDETADEPTARDLTPRYVGKAEAWGTGNELSENFKEIAKERNGTKKFARWGDGDYWHVGELSNTLLRDSNKKESWAKELFASGSRTLEQQVYLWIRAWDPESLPGPYGYNAYLAEAEPLLISLAYQAYPDELLNDDVVPN